MDKLFEQSLDISPHNPPEQSHVQSLLTIPLTNPRPKSDISLSTHSLNPLHAISLTRSLDNISLCNIFGIVQAISF